MLIISYLRGINVSENLKFTSRYSQMCFNLLSSEKQVDNEINYIKVTFYGELIFNK